MRHYYRFMELEPVLEMEEDSVGDESPSSSMGSPSLSPPPDVWAQLIGKEYQDSAYNLLLQDHLDLQRSYRLLEVQYRNCENRAARSIKESYAQIQGLKETLKEVLMSQETDKLAAIREELHRVKDRESKLNEEAYDLREQNELLEFRILELEECNEHTSLRGVEEQATRDTGTSMDDGEITPRQPNNSIVELERAIVNRPTASVSPVPALSATLLKNERQAAEKNLLELQTNADEIDRETLESSLTPSRRYTQSDTALTSQSYRQSRTNQQSTELEHTSDINEGLWMGSASPPEFVPSLNHETIPHLTSFISESISCNLCRRSPRRRSLTGGRVVEVEAQRGALRKSKSDGEIKKLGAHLGQESYDFDHLKFTPSSEESIRKSNEFMLDQIDGIKRRAEIPTDCTRSVRNPSGDSHTKISSLSKYSNISSEEEEQLVVVKNKLDAIHDILKETRIEVECTNSELREEVVTLEGALIRLTQEMTRRKDSSSCQEDGEETASLQLQDFLTRHSCSLSSSKECHCCSKELRPALEDVIAKLQQLTQLVDDNQTTMGRFSEQINTTELTSREMESSKVEDKVELPAVIEARKAFGTTTEAPAIRKEIHVWSFIPDTEEDTMQEESIIRTESNKVVANIESMKNEIDILEKNITLHHKSEVTSDSNENSIAQSKLEESSIYMDRPIAEENLDSCKPVLRRWREHLNVRENRAKSWAGGASEFPKTYQPTATVN